MKNFYFFALLAGVFFSLSNCSAPTPTCGPSNCAGCCSETGMCLSGTENNACGAQGNECSVCAAGRTCVAKVCVSKNPGDTGGSISTGGMTSAGGNVSPSGGAVAQGGGAMGGGQSSGGSNTGGAQQTGGMSAGGNTPTVACAGKAYGTCSGGMACYFNSSGNYECNTPGGLQPGEACVPLSKAVAGRCQPGYDCQTYNTASSTTGRCEKSCNKDIANSCGANAACFITGMCLQKCALATKSTCPAGLYCFPIPAATGLAGDFCTNFGALPLSSACKISKRLGVSTEVCVDSGDCFPSSPGSDDGTCRELCSTQSNQCLYSGNQCVPTSGGLGFCQ